MRDEGRISACAGKKRLTPVRAKKIAARRRRSENEAAHAYHCPFCREWHVGTDHRPKPVHPRSRNNVME